MSPNLSFEQAPPISVPFRMFLTAPWFAVAAGLLLAVTGADAIASRWSTSTLALTHLLVLGFMLQAMLGALFQFVPVAAGGNVWQPRRVVAIVHPTITLGTVLLVTGFLAGGSILFRAAIVAFALGVSLFVGVVGVALLRTPAVGQTVRALRLALLGLAIAVALGTGLAEGFAGLHPWPLVDLTNIHATWGLAGWALVLLVGVSYFVVPMFQLTPQYPARLAALLPIGLVAAAGLVSLPLLGFHDSFAVAGKVATTVLAAGYAAVTLILQQKRRRRVIDPTLLAFRVAMVCLLTAAVSVLVLEALPDISSDGRVAWWLGVLIVPGVFLSAITGMLYKIVPFLNWLHLQRQLPAGQLAPSAREMIPEARMKAQLSLHFAAVVLLLAAAIWPPAAPPAGLLFAGSNLWLAVNLIGAVRAYRGFKARIPEAAASPSR